MRKFTLSILFAASWLCLAAQGAATMGATGSRSYTPADKWELGLHLGIPGVVGDFDYKPGFGGGLHVRKSLDHIFSVRGVFLYAKTSGERDGTPQPSYDLSWLSGSGQVVIALNNLRFNKPYRKVLFNVYAGLGVNSFQTDHTNIPNRPDTEDPDETSAHAEGGGEIAFRISPKMNFSVGYTMMMPFGQGADLLDGDRNVDLGYTTYRDNLHYPHVSLNFNLGKKTKSGAMRTEPLYWVNPMAQYNEAIAALEARPVYDGTDTDGDGVIDAIDEEKDSPKGARVDTRGVTLDSDGDSYPDYKDKEPYSPPGYKVDGMGVAQVPKEKILTEDEVNRMIDAKLANFKLPAVKTNDWFLPMVHFDFNRYDIKKSEYEKLYHVATVLKQNPGIRVVAIGHTDGPASPRYNNVLSYNRAKAAIEFLVSQYGIDRSRLILNWGGEDTNLVPSKGQNATNRRVEFKVATNETEMGRPEGPNAGRGKFSGNKDAGY